ncbi:MAG TPA: hypothetical protein VH255_10515 [Verrucomicrobiae bacterium]|nr:hypothetical protein [Verrucomicrobiae bacterium]
MSLQHKPVTPLDLSKWRKAPAILLVGGGAIALVAAAVSHQHDDFKEFGYAWLTAFMFFLSVGLGGLLLTMLHHLFDAGWSVSIRRINENLATLLFPWMAILFIPIALLAPRIYHWMAPSLQAHPDHALLAKQPLFTIPGFYIASAVCFLIWWLLSNRLRYWSVTQDTTGGSKPTFRMRWYSYWGIFAFAISLTLGAVMWMKGLQDEWFSTMYGVYYFAGSTWMTLTAVYVITTILHRQGLLPKAVMHHHQFYYLGSIIFAFTVFYAYVTFAQYFIIWNGNMPEETFWYQIRERGTWFYVGLVIIFGHFFVPFLGLLRIDVKSCFPYMLGIACWAWLMHFVDMIFNVQPVIHPTGFPIQWIWMAIGCWMFMAGFLSMVFLKKTASVAAYPLKDPRLVEAMGHLEPHTPISGGDIDETQVEEGY